MKNSTLAQEFMMNSTALDVEGDTFFQRTCENNFKMSTAVLVLGTTLSLIHGVSLDAADDIRTAQISSFNDLQADNRISTTIEEPVIITDFVTKSVKKAMNGARYELFESGIESSFSQFIKRVVALYGQKAITAICTNLNDSNLSEDIITEAIRSLGVIEDFSTKTDRFKAILPYLNHKLPIVRDAAALAFADLGDKGAISYLRVTAQHEKFSAVRSSLLSVANELEEI